MGGQKKRGFSIYIFLAILCFIYTLMIDTTWRLTGSETRLTQHLIAENSIHYMFDNTCALARDYIRQWTSSGNAPNFLLRPDAFAYYTTTGVINLNAMLDLEKRGWIWPKSSQSISNGSSVQQLTMDPIAEQITLSARFNRISFNKAIDSDIFKADLILGLRAKGKATAGPVLRNRVFHVFEHIELTRRPLTSFQVFADGDFSLYSFWQTDFTGPVHVNGNLYLAAFSSATMTSATMSFTEPVSIGGNLLRLTYLSGDKIDANRGSLYEDVHLNDRGRNFLLSVYAPSQLPKSVPIPGSGNLNANGNIYFAKNALKSGSTNGLSYKTGSSDYLTSDCTTYTLSSPARNFLSYEALAFYYWRFWPESRYAYWPNSWTRAWNADTVPSPIPTNFQTLFPYVRPKQPWVRLAGYDPTQYNSETDTTTNNLKTIEMNFGCYALLRSRIDWNSAFTTAATVRKDYTQFTLSGSNLQDAPLTEPQMVERYNVLESQKMANQPGLFIRVLPNTGFNYTKLLEAATTAPYDAKIYVKIKEKKPYVLYNEDLNTNDVETARIAVWGHVLRAKYVNTNNPILNVEAFCRSETGSSLDTLTTSPGFQKIVNNNELRYQQVIDSNVSQDTYKDKFVILSREQTIPDLTSEVDGSYNFSPTSSFKQTTPYIFFDKNRRKWIQLIDIDVGQLATAFNAHPEWKNFIGIVGAENPNFNLNLIKAGLTDYRINYRANRTDTNTFYYFSAIGVRLKNAASLPNGGLTVFSQFPIYLQGNFNTTNVQSRAAIVSDSITVLSNQWLDYGSRLHSEHPLKTPVSANVTINAHLITGSSHPDFMTIDTNKLPECGNLNVVKVLEKWGNYKINLGGGIIVPFRSKIAWEPWSTTNAGNVINSLAPLNLSPNTNLSFTRPLNPPGCPFVYEIKSGRPNHYIYDLATGKMRDVAVKDYDSL